MKNYDVIISQAVQILAKGNQVALVSIAFIGNIVEVSGAIIDPRKYLWELGF